MSFQLQEADLDGLIASLRLFNQARQEHGVNLCAYGSIDIEVGDGGYLRLDHVEGVGYVYAERFQ